MITQEGRLPSTHPVAEPALTVQWDNLLEQRVEPSEATGELQKLISAASVLKVDGSNDEQVLWKDLEQGCPRIVDWINASASPGYTMGLWLNIRPAD